MCQENGLTTVILYCGDQDPAGLQISDVSLIDRICVWMKHRKSNETLHFYKKVFTASANDGCEPAWHFRSLAHGIYTP